LWNALFPARLEDQLQQMQHVVVVNPFGHLGKQHIVPNTIEIGL
jgi:hypothetical protein